MPELASINGNITPIDQACVPINDRGFVFGDGVYEVIACFGGRMFLGNEHMVRLRRSLDAVRLEYVEVDPIFEQICILFEKSQLSDAKVYLQITRGVAPRDHAFPKPVPEPNVIITIRELHENPIEWYERGVRCITARDIRWGRVDIKTINLLPNVLAKQEALDKGCYEAIFISDQDEVREGTSANLFIIKNGELWTHPCNEHILPGITREFLLGLAHKEGIVCHERAVSRQFLMDADEVFLSGTTTEVLPVVEIDGKPVGAGKSGKISLQLLKLFQKWIKAEIDK